MAAYMPPGPPRPSAGNNPNQPLHQQQPQPSYGNPNALADGIQNMNLHRAPPPNYTPRPNPVAQPQQPFSTPPPGTQPMSRPGPPPAGAFGRPSGQGTIPTNAAFSRPTGPPVGQPGISSYRSPPPPGVLPSNMGFPARTPVSGAFPAGAGTAAPSVGSTLSGARPQMGPVGLMTGPVLPSVSTPPGAVINGPPPPPMFGASRFAPPAGGVSQQLPGATPPLMPSMLRGSTAVSAPPATPMQSAPHFTVSPHAVPHPPSSPFAAQTWPVRPDEVGSPPLPGTTQPPRFGIPPSTIPNQPLTSISPGMMPPGGSGTSKIDPNQIPRPIPGSAVVIHETRQNNQANPPPPATSDYIVRDTGNCSPRFMRCTINQIPCTADLLTTSGMQMALLIQPFSLPHPSEEPIQIVDFGESGPVRCSRCKGYINPFMKFIDQGRQFICNLCGFNDETPRDYHCNLGPDGRRRDADQRAELCRGTVEFVASKEYMIREPMPAVYFFIIDVSMNAIQTGASAASCSAISQVIADLPEGPRTMVGVATFDSTIHFYNLKRALQQPLMLIVPDIQDVYTPLQSDVIVPLSECRHHLELLLENIPTMFQHNSTAESAFGAAVKIERMPLHCDNCIAMHIPSNPIFHNGQSREKGAFLAMKSTGGKLLVFQSVLPSVGIGALSAREAEGRTNISAGEKEAHKLLQPADKTLKTMAIEFAEYQVCVDVFLTTQSYVDIASISVVSRTTGGQVYYYHPFSAISDSGKLYNDLRWNITRPQGFEAVMRVRCSQGVQVQEYHGNFCKRIPTDIDLPGIDCDKTIMVTLKHDDKLQDGTEIAFQCALLYTTVYGQRRIRITTLSLPCTSLLTNLFRAADLDAQFTCLLKQAGGEIPTTPLSQVQQQATNNCINILLAYRKFCATVSSAGQLILPEALKLFPLYTLALTKSTGLRNEGKIDDRSFWVNYVSSISTLAIPLVYPRMISIHDLNSKDVEGSIIPPVIPLSSEHVNDDGIYLLENGEDALIYVGGSVNPETLSKLFGVSAVEEIPTQFVLQQFDNPVSKKLNEIVNEIRRQRCSYLRFRLCKKGDQSGMLFYSYLVEDKNHGGLSYVEFLVYIHRQIQMKMS